MIPRHISITGAIETIIDPSKNRRVLVRFLDEFPLYAVTLDGRVWCESRQRFTSGRPNTYGHPQVECRSEYKVSQLLVSRLVSFAWISNPHGFSHVRHLDDDPKNNIWENLIWTKSNAEARNKHGKR